MSMKVRAWLLASSLAAGTAPALAQPNPAPAPSAAPSGAPVTVPAPNVRAGIEAWQAGNYALAIGNWRPLADRGDPEAFPGGRTQDGWNQFDGTCAPARSRSKEVNAEDAEASRAFVAGPRRSHVDDCGLRQEG